MTIVQLVKATLITPVGRLSRVIDQLYSFGEFHVESDEGSESYLEVSQLYAKARSLSIDIEAIVRQLNLSADQGAIDVLLKGERIERSTLTVEGIKELITKLEEEARRIIPEVRGILEELSRINSKVEELQALESTLSIMASIGLNVSKLRGLRRFHVGVFTASIRDVAELKRSLEEAHLLDVPIGRNLALILIIAKREYADRVERVTRGFNLKRFDASIAEGEPIKAYEELKSRTSELLREREELNRRLDSLRVERGMEILALRDVAVMLRDSLSRLRGRPLKRVAVIEGYIPKDREGELIERLGGEAYIEISEIKRPHSGQGGHGGAPSPPTLMRHNKYFGAYRAITELQGTPGYFEIDPTPYVSIFFAIFYGVMFADAGQGLVISALGMTLWMRSKGLLKTWGRLLTFLGISSTIGGLFIMEFFGFKISGLLGVKPIIEIVEHKGEAVTLSPDAVLLLFQFTLLLGFVHVSLGMFLGALKLLKNGEVVEAITSKLNSLAMYVFGLLFVLAFLGAGGFEEITTSPKPVPLLGLPSGTVGSVALYGLLTSISILLLGRLVAGHLGLGQKISVLAAIGGGLLEVLENIIHFMSNTLSYLRLAILLLIHIALMLLVNAAWEGLGPASLPILIIGNIGVMGLEGVLVFIQALRLHLYEFFTKFYEGTGTQFNPLRIASRLVDVVVGMPAGQRR